MTKFELNQVDVRGDGRVVLYQRPDRKKPKWQCRISVQGSTGYKRFSTGETDIRNAERVALEKYEELYFKVKRGGSLKGKPFATLYLEWVESFGTNPSSYNQEMMGKVERMGLVFFGKKPIDEITESDFHLFMGSLSGEDGKAYATSSIRQVRTALNLIFKFAKTQGYIDVLPDIPAPSLIRNPRPDFTKQDWRVLTSYMRVWVVATPNGLRGKNGLDHKRERERYYLQQYILILSNTGIRIGEMRNVRWADLDSVAASEGDERLLFYVDGKTGKREVVANAGVEVYIKRLWDFRSKELGKPPDMTEPVFCHPNGNRIRNYRKGFENLLNKCGLRQDGDGTNRTLYSLRHTYATFRINVVPVYQLAVNMGTSVEMIEDYYSHARSKDPSFVSTITKGNQKGSGKALPF